jgi:hypothetical protein
MKDPRTAKLMRELSRRFPGVTMVTGPMLDEPGSGEVHIHVLNAPSNSLRAVETRARRLIWKLFRDGPHPVYVTAVNPTDSIKYYAEHLAKARKTRVVRRRRAAPSKRATAR